MPDYTWAFGDDWRSAWDPFVELVGQDLSPGTVEAAEPIESSIVRRFIEPLEFDCPLFYDAETAKAHGYSGAIAPYSGLTTWTSPGIWNPGDEPVYTEANRNTAPRERQNLDHWAHAPDWDSALASDIEYEYHQPFLLGDRLSVRGQRLLSVVPKQTKVGRGAFTMWESLIFNQNDIHLATQRFGMYAYVAGTFPATGEG